jgi:hypothetical protein
MELNKTPEELIDAWIARLEDPNAKQARGYLKTSEGQCCLGVYCDVLASVGGVEVSAKVGYKSNVDGDVFDYTIDGGVYRTYPPEGPMHKIGLSQNGSLLDGAWDIPENSREQVRDTHLGSTDTNGAKSRANLAAFNDEAKLSFAQIAEILKLNKAKMIELAKRYGDTSV